MKTVVVLGAYGLAGREITALLLQKTKLKVVACGRNEKKLSSLRTLYRGDRLATLLLDASNEKAVWKAFASADLVINCVGPYTSHGARLARMALASGAHYLDLASEQAHYRRLELLHDLAARNGRLLVTACGLIPGLSSLLMVRNARRVGDAEILEAFYAQARMPSPESGLGSLLTGVLEVGSRPLSLSGGRLTPTRVGSKRRRIELPQPVGRVSMLAAPTIDALTVPEKVSVRSLETYFALGTVPPGFLQLIRILKPQSRPRAYRLLRALTEWGMRMDYKRAERKGLGPDALVKVVAEGRVKRVETTVRLSDGAIGTAYLPVLVARKLELGELRASGLKTPLDLFTWEEMAESFARLGWKLALTESEKRAG